MRARRQPLPWPQQRTTSSSSPYPTQPLFPHPTGYGLKIGHQHIIRRTTSPAAQLPSPIYPTHPPHTHRWPPARRKDEPRPPPVPAARARHPPGPPQPPPWRLTAGGAACVQSGPRRLPLGTGCAAGQKIGRAGQARCSGVAAKAAGREGRQCGGRWERGGARAGQGWQWRECMRGVQGLARVHVRLQQNAAALSYGGRREMCHSKGVTLPQALTTRGWLHDHQAVSKLRGWGGCSRHDAGAVCSTTQRALVCRAACQPAKHQGPEEENMALSAALVRSARR